MPTATPCSFMPIMPTQPVMVKVISAGVLWPHVQHQHVGRGRGVHVPGLPQIAIAIGASGGCNDKGGAVDDVAGARLRNALSAQHGGVGEDVHEVGEAVHDHQFVDPDAGGVGHAAHLLHQLGRKGFVMLEAGASNRQRFLQRRLLSAGPEGIAAETQPLFGQFGDLSGVGLAMDIAQFVGCSCYG